MLHCEPGLFGAGRDHDGEAGEGPHDGDILKRVVSGPQMARREPTVSACDPHRQPVIGDVDLDDLQRASGGKSSHGGDERHLATCRQARGDTHQIVLGDAEVDVTVSGRAEINAGEQAGVAVQAE